MDKLFNTSVPIKILSTIIVANIYWMWPCARHNERYCACIMHVIFMTCVLDTERLSNTFRVTQPVLLGESQFTTRSDFTKLPPHCSVSHILKACINDSTTQHSESVDWKSPELTLTCTHSPFSAQPHGGSSWQPAQPRSLCRGTRSARTQPAAPSPAGRPGSASSPGPTVLRHLLLWS